MAWPRCLTATKKQPELKRRIKRKWQPFTRKLGSSLWSVIFFGKGLAAEPDRPCGDGCWPASKTTIYRPLPYIKAKLGGRIGIGAEIRAVQAIFKRIFQGFRQSSRRYEPVEARRAVFVIALKKPDG